MASKSAPQPVMAKVSGAALAQAEPSPARLRRPISTASPAVAKLARAEMSEDSPVRGAPSPSARRNIASPFVDRIGGPSALPRPVIPAVATSKLPGPAEPIAPSRTSALQPLNRHTAVRPPSDPIRDDILAAINDIWHDDNEQSVEAIRLIEQILEEDPDRFKNNIRTLNDTLIDEMERAFSPPENLNDAAIFRLVKHLLQAISGITCNQNLVRRLKYDDMYSLIYCLTLRLVQADILGGQAKELSKFMNLILVQALSTPDRIIVLKVMFKMLGHLSRDFTRNPPLPESAEAGHAELVMKCLWKRGRLLDDDFRAGRVKPSQVFGLMEEFLTKVNPAEYRKRQDAGVVMGDMPLRTIKTIIQRTVGE